MILYKLKVEYIYINLQINIHKIHGKGGIIIKIRWNNYQNCKYKKNCKFSKHKYTYLTNNKCNNFYNIDVKK